MKLTKYEKFMLYIIGFLDFLETVFIKHFRTGAFAFLLIYVYNVAGGLERGNVTIAEANSTFLVALRIIGVLFLVYKLLIYKEKSRGRRRNKYVCKHSKSD